MQTSVYLIVDPELAVCGWLRHAVTVVVEQNALLNAEDPHAIRSKRAATADEAGCAIHDEM
jgi:hypothetical protein